VAVQEKFLRSAVARYPEVQNLDLFVAEGTAGIQLLFEQSSKRLLEIDLKCFDHRVAQDNDPKRVGRLFQRPLSVAEPCAVDLYECVTFRPKPSFSIRPKSQPHAVVGPME
jgi:hypothetical protein